MQVAGPAYGIALDAWGDEFLAHGVVDLKFVGMVTDGQTVDATVEVTEGDTGATLTVTNRDTGAVVVVGSMLRSR
jgi:acyl dehydratase